MEATSGQLMGLLEQEMARMTLEKRRKNAREQTNDMGAQNTREREQPNTIRSQASASDGPVDEEIKNRDVRKRKTGCRL